MLEPLEKVENMEADKLAATSGDPSSQDDSDTRASENSPCKSHDSDLVKASIDSPIINVDNPSDKTDSTSETVGDSSVKTDLPTETVDDPSDKIDLQAKSLARPLDAVDSPSKNENDDVDDVCVDASSISQHNHAEKPVDSPTKDLGKVSASSPLKDQSGNKEKASEESSDVADEVISSQLNGKIENIESKPDVIEDVSIRSRYGRTHKPKPLIDGFLTTDKKVGAFLGHSPQSSPRKKEDSSRLSLRSLKKVSPPKQNNGETLMAALKSLQDDKEAIAPATLPKPKRRRGRPRLSAGNLIKNIQKINSPSELVTTNESLYDVNTCIKKLFTSDDNTTSRKRRNKTTKAIAASPKTKNAGVSNNPSDNLDDTMKEFQCETTDLEKDEIKIKVEREDAEAMAEKESDSGVESSATAPPSEPEDGIGLKEDNKVESIGVAVSQGEWLVGDLVWGHIKGHPFWPCIVVHEPEQGIYIKTQNVGRNKMSHFHVRFFGDNARRSWIRSNQVIKFNGSKDYLRLIEEHPNRKKDFEVTPKNIPKWKLAIQEAEKLVPLSRSERLETFSSMFPDMLKDEAKAEDKLNRSVSGTSKVVARRGRKRPHPENSSPSSSETESLLKDDVITKERSNKVKYKVKRKRVKPLTGFDAYSEKHRDRVVDEFPDLDAEGIDVVVKQRWDTMEESVKARYDAHANEGSTDGSKSSDDDEIMMEEESEESSNDKVELKPKSVARKRVRKSLAKMGVTHRRGGLFKGLKMDKVCIQCEEPGGEVLKCRGPCLRFFHAKCAPKMSKGTDGNEDFRCGDCVSNVKPPCNACWKEEGLEKKEDERKRCNQHGCGRYYHEECLAHWPQAWWSRQTFTCPAHCCHTCASDDPRESRMHTSLAEKLVRCIRCPATYHSGDFCLPAGCVALTGSQIICQRHYKIPKKGAYHMNTSWCFICSMGGSLICCDRCPSSFHPQCLNITAPEGSYICEDCDSARYPLYGEVVWVKLGRYRWWPAQILYPSEIPENVQSLPHALGEFAVRFFGSHDHYWVNNGRAFLYQQGDSAKTAPPKSGTDALFARALEEASVYYTKHAEEKAEWEAANVTGRNNSFKPPRFVRIKTNKPVGDIRPFETVHASYTPCDCDPQTEKPCSQEPNCLNRMLMVECVPGVCRAGERCCNQRFQKRQYPPLSTCRTEGRGWGLRTLADISQGDFVVEYVGEMINEAECHRRIERMHRLKDENYYFLTIDKDHILDAGPKGNLSRFMNHSCSPNCETQKWTVGGETRVGLFALCDIPAGTELTFNYNLQVIGTERRPCLCGAPNCIRFIGAKTKSEQEESNAVNTSEVPVKKPKLKIKKRGRPSKLLANVCHKCGHGGELINCVVKTCGKNYHLSCTELSEEPTGKWTCPLHQCAVCKIKPHAQCSKCCLSFCRTHVSENVNGKLDITCSQHVKLEAPPKNGSDDDGPKEEKLSEEKPTNKEVVEDSRAKTPRQRSILRNKLAQQNES